MAILNYTTQIAAEKTIAEISKCLVKHGASKILTDYRDNIPTAVTFCLTVNGQNVFFALPANYQGVLKALQADPDVPLKLRTKDQALRVSWRIIKDWIEAQMAIVEANLADIAEVFIPYAIHKSGETLYNHLKNTNMLMLNQ